jgi:ketosteroid isomerase-like protein
MSLTYRITAVLFLTAAAAMADSAADVLAADKGWATAIQKMDYPALEKMLAEELVYTHSSGLIDTKKQYIDNLKTGAQKYNQVEHVDPKVQVHGSTAVLTTGLKMDTTTKGVNQKAMFRLIHVWVKKGGTWQMVAHQTTRLP